MIGWFLSLAPGSSSQSVLTQTPSATAVTLGETALLQCTLEGVQFINDKNPAWYQQRGGNAPRLLIYQSRNRASDIPERFSGETYNNRATLTINGIQAEDEADYYCAVWHNDSYHSDTVRWGTETKTPLMNETFLFAVCQLEAQVYAGARKHTHTHTGSHTKRPACISHFDLGGRLPLEVMRSESLGVCGI